MLQLRGSSNQDYKNQHHSLTVEDKMLHKNWRFLTTNEIKNLGLFRIL